MGTEAIGIRLSGGVLPSPPRVVNIRDYAPGALPADAVYIGRSSPIYGLPSSKWSIHIPMKGQEPSTGEQRSRAWALARYREHLLSRPDLLAALPELAGKTLLCWCAPKPCHGDVLAELYERDRTARAHLLGLLERAPASAGGAAVDQGVVAIARDDLELLTSGATVFAGLQRSARRLGFPLPPATDGRRWTVGGDAEAQLAALEAAVVRVRTMLGWRR